MRQETNRETGMIAANRTTSRRMPPPTCLPAVNSHGVAVDHRRLKRKLHAALAAGALVLHYQPRFCLATGKIVANEALVRLQHRERSLIPPGILIPATEQSNVADLFGAWMLAEACVEAARWSTARLSLNVSAWRLQPGVLPVQLAAVLEQSGLPPDRLELELAASSLADSRDDTLLALSAIRDLGIGLAVDNFGAGSADLPMLKRLPLTAVKLSRSLSRELPTRRSDGRIVRTVIETGRAMRLTTVAEGIETEAQRAFLSGIGCDEGQGYFFSQPLPAGQLRPMLDAVRA